MRRAALLLASLYAGVALAQAGKLVHLPIPGDDQDPLYIDAGRIKWRGSIVDFRYVLDVPILCTTTDGGAPRFRSNEVEATIDCARRTIKLGTVTAYSAVARTGEATGGFSPKPGESPPQQIGEHKGETMGYLYRYFCIKPEGAAAS